MGSFIMKSRLGAPGLSLFGQEGAPLRGARKLPARWRCAAHGIGAPRAGRLRMPKSRWPKPAVLEGGWELVVKAMGGGLDGASDRRALTPGPSFAQAGAPRAQQSPPDTAAGANSHCTKIGLRSISGPLKGASECTGQALLGQANPCLVVSLEAKLLEIFGGQVTGECGTPWLA